MLRINILLFALISLTWIHKTPVLQNGNYQFNILREDGEKIVFTTLVKDSLGKKIMYVINGSEKMLVDDIRYMNDSVYIQLPFYESGFHAKIKTNGDLEGIWVKHFGPVIQKMPFTAIFNTSERFKITKKSEYNITGRWSVNFTDKNNRVTLSVGEFVQNGSHLSGTFLLSSGDYRFLEGVVSSDSIYLSGFDGANALLFIAKINDAQHISGGKLYSGKSGLYSWIGEKNEQASLPEEESTLKVKPNAGKLTFRFRDMNGKYVSINDDTYKNKVVVIQILGSWCPNCLDETQFFVENYQYYHDKGVEFIGIAYERTDNFKASQKALEPFVKRLRIPYPILITDVALSDPLRTEKTLPQIENINAFPTTIFVGKDGNISKVHSGFDGPATGVHYDMYKKQFNETIDKMLQQN